MDVDADANETPRHVSQPPGAISNKPTEPVVANPLVKEHGQLLQAESLSRHVYLGDASGIAFGMKLRQFIRGEDEPSLLQNKHRYFKSPTLARLTNSSFQLPEKTYGLILIRLVKRFLGGTHHLNLESSFMKRLHEVYISHEEDPLWICRLFFLFALGELYSNKTIRSQSDDIIPGTDSHVPLADAYC